MLKNGLCLSFWKTKLEIFSLQLIKFSLSQQEVLRYFIALLTILESIAWKLYNRSLVFMKHLVDFFVLTMYFGETYTFFSHCL